MLRKQVKYVDFDGNPKSETLYFNLTKAETQELALRYKGSAEVILHKMVEDDDKEAIFAFIKNLVLASYGKRDSDGNFIKTKELSEMFSHSEAYSQLIDDVTTDEKEAIAFFKGIFPESMRNTILPSN